MKRSCLLAAVAASLAMASDERSSGGGTPPVLRRIEPADTVEFRLPGPPVVERPALKIVTAPPIPLASKLAYKIVPAPLPPLPVIPVRPEPKPETTADVKPSPMPKAPAPVVDTKPSPLGKAIAAAPPKPELPAEMVQDVGFFCQKQVGHWKQSDVRELFGPAKRSRSAYDENKTANGRIYAFADPTGRYRELELDFDSKTGLLRTVFVYPLTMTWEQVRRRWTGEVTAADAKQGRKFYSYGNRRMDVLVDSQGKVISLGLY